MQPAALSRLKDRRTPLKPLLRCFHEFDKDVDGTETHTRRIAFEYETCEATAGTLRLARRGNQLYYLLAEEKSEYFRVIGVREVCTEPIMDGGIQLLNQLKSVTEDAVTSVVWTNVTVQAEKILRDPANQPVNAQSLANLNQGRDQLSPLVDFDFASMQSGVEKFTRWGNVASFRHTPDGVRFTSLGTENWTSTGAWPGTQLQGDFDASSTFEIEKIVAPEPIGESNVYMQAIFSDEQETCYNLSVNDDVLTFRVRTTDANGRLKHNYLNREQIKDLSGLRIARRGDVIHAIVTAGQPAEERVFGAGRLTEETVNTSARITFLVQTRGLGRETHCLWKKVSVHLAPPPPLRLPKPPGGA